MRTDDDFFPELTKCALFQNRFHPYRLHFCDTNASLPEIFMNR